MKRSLLDIPTGTAQEGGHSQLFVGLWASAGAMGSACYQMLKLGLAQRGGKEVGRKRGTGLRLYSLGSV